MADSSIALIAGIGNPGDQYLGTRHNAGIDFINELCRRHQGSWTKESKFHGQSALVAINNQPVRLLWSDTFMNHSGKAIAAIANFYKIDSQRIVVAHDELDLPVGTIRFKQAGGHGGHNGLRDIIKCLGNDNSFARVRIGIGHPGHASKVLSYVLQRPSVKDQIGIDLSIQKAIDEIPSVITGNWQPSMHRLHSDN